MGVTVTVSRGSTGEVLERAKLAFTDEEVRDAVLRETPADPDRALAKLVMEAIEWHSLIAMMD